MYWCMLKYFKLFYATNSCGTFKHWQSAVQHQCTLFMPQLNSLIWHAQLQFIQISYLFTLADACACYSSFSKPKIHFMHSADVWNVPLPLPPHPTTATATTKTATINALKPGTRYFSLPLGTVGYMYMLLLVVLSYAIHRIHFSSSITWHAKCTTAATGCLPDRLSVCLSLSPLIGARVAHAIELQLHLWAYK